MVAHFGGAAGMFLLSGVGGWIAPLIALLAKGNESPTVRAHAVQSLNFFLTWSIVGALSWPLMCIFIGFITLPIAVLMGIILGIIAGVKASNGELYQYPASIKMVK